MQVTTGGSDTTIATGGVTLNMVTKRGTNEWRGSGPLPPRRPGLAVGLRPRRERARQARPASHRLWPDERPGCLQAGQPHRVGRGLRRRGRRPDRQGPPLDLGLLRQAGGRPADHRRRQRLHRAGDRRTSSSTPRSRPSNSATVFALNSDKVKIGRNAGPTRPQATTWNQSKFGDDPTAWKVEDTHIFSSAFYLTGLYSMVNGGFQLVPQGGADRNGVNAELGRELHLAATASCSTRPSVRRSSSRPTPRPSSTPAT